MATNPIDDWFLGYKTRAVKSKDRGGLYLGNGRRPSKPLKSGSGLTNLKAAALKHPEVMVKIPRRLSSNSKGIAGVRGHLDYVSRNGKIQVETNDGERLNGKREVRDLVEDWKRLGIAEHTKHKEALNIVLSMPPGTPPQAVLDAARNFAAEQFEGHKYAFALHHESDKEGEPPHPHVHLCVLVRNQFGDRLNPRKNDLFEWRVRFAEKLREEGVQCAATRRQHRGITQKPEKGVFRAIKSRGQVPNRYRQQAEELIEAVKHNERPTHQSLKKIMHTRGLIVDEYGKIAKELYKMGHKTEARIISRLAKETAAQPRDTKAQQQFDTALNNGMTAEKLIQNLKHQLDESEQFSNLARKLSESGHKAEAKLMQDIAVAAAGRSIVGETSVERSNNQSAEKPSLHHEHGDDGLTR
jgi:plasmid-related protein